MSALAQKQTSRQLQPMFALPPKADVDGASSDVRYVPKADMNAVRTRLIDFESRCLDDNLPLLNFCFQKLREFVS